MATKQIMTTTASHFCKHKVQGAVRVFKDQSGREIATLILELKSSTNFLEWKSGPGPIFERAHLLSQLKQSKSQKKHSRRQEPPRKHFAVTFIIRTQRTYQSNERKKQASLSRQRVTMARGPKQTSSRLNDTEQGFEGIASTDSP